MNELPILLVDDEAAVLRLVSGMLSCDGHNVLQTTGPSEALRVFKECGGAVKLLLTDIVMPDGSGVRLADELAALQPGLPVVFMTGYNPEHLGPDNPEQRGGIVLYKPFSMQAVRDTVRNALR